MPHFFSLELDPTPGAPQSGTVHRLGEAGLTINHALLTGELLGVDVSLVLELLREIDDARRVAAEHLEPSEPPDSRLFPDDVTVLLKSLGSIAEALDQALDQSGKPKNMRGEELARSPLVRRESDGSLAIRSRHLPLAELRLRLAKLLDFLRRAERNQATVNIVG